MADMATRDIAAPSPPEGAALLPLRRRNGDVVAYAIIDAEDYDRLGQFRWHLQSSGYVARNVPHPSGRMTRHGHRQQTPLGLHRAVMGLGFGDPRKIDHKDHNPLDNRKSNLRIGTHAQNLQNRRGGNKGSSSRYRGVSWNKQRKSWCAYASPDGRMKFLGYFDDEDEAGRVAAEFRREHMTFATD